MNRDYVFSPSNYVNWLSQLGREPSERDLPSLFSRIQEDTKGVVNIHYERGFIEEILYIQCEDSRKYFFEDSCFPFFLPKVKKVRAVPICETRAGDGKWEYLLRHFFTCIHLAEFCATASEDMPEFRDHFKYKNKRIDVVFYGVEESDVLTSFHYSIVGSVESEAKEVGTLGPSDWIRFLSSFNIHEVNYGLAAFFDVRDMELVERGIIERVLGNDNIIFRNNGRFSQWTKRVKAYSEKRGHDYCTGEISIERTPQQAIVIERI